MVTKEAAMSFSQFGYPYNATSQVSHFAIFVFFIIIWKFAVHTRALLHKHSHNCILFFRYFICIHFFCASLRPEHSSLEETLMCEWLLWQLSARGAFVVKPNIDIHAPVSNYTELWMNSRVFADDNRDECHIGVIWLWRWACWGDISPKFIFKSVGQAFD